MTRHTGSPCSAGAAAGVAAAAPSPRRTGILPLHPPPLRLAACFPGCGTSWTRHSDCPGSRCIAVCRPPRFTRPHAPLPAPTSCSSCWRRSCARRATWLRWRASPAPPGSRDSQARQGVGRHRGGVGMCRPRPAPKRGWRRHGASSSHGRTLRACPSPPPLSLPSPPAAGFDVKIEGFNDRLSCFVDTVFETLKGLDVSEAVFDRVMEGLRKQVRSRRFGWSCFGKCSAHGCSSGW